MKKYYYITGMLFSLFTISCDENPMSNEEEILTPISECSIQGLGIEFEDSCSYDFIIGFLASYDSITIQESFLGSTFYLYADSGNYNYWEDYFANDSTIQNMYGYNSSDSLILVITLTGKKSTEEERQRFLNITNLEIINIEEYPKFVYISVPEATETEWQSLFEEYSFISHVFVIAICITS